MMDVDERDCEPSPPRSPDSIGSCGVLNRPRRRPDARHSPLFPPRACLSRPPSPDHRSLCYVLAQCADACRPVQVLPQPGSICLRYRDTVRLTVRPQIMSDLLYAPTPSITAGPEHAAAPHQDESVLETCVAVSPVPSVCPPRRVPIRVSPRQRASRAGSRATPSHHRSRVRHQRCAIYLQPIGSPEAARVRPLECPVRTQPRPVYVHRWQHPKYSEVALLSGCLSLSRGSRWPSMALLFSIWHLVSLLPLAAAADDERGLSSAGNSHVRTVAGA